MLSIEQILAADDIKTVPVDVPEWGGSAKMRVLPAVERERLVASFRENGKLKQDAVGYFSAAWVAHCLVDDEGNRIIPDAKVNDLATKSGVVLERLYGICQELNSPSEAKIEAAEKN